MHDATETLTSIVLCLNRELDFSALIVGRSASCIDLDGACSTVASNCSTFWKKKNKKIRLWHYENIIATRIHEKVVNFLPVESSKHSKQDT